MFGIGEYDAPENNYKAQTVGLGNIDDIRNRTQGGMDQQKQRANYHGMQSQTARGQQDQLAGLLYRQSMGKAGPSAAEGQLQAGQEAAMRQTMAMAAGARGNPYLARRSAIDAQAGLAGQTNQQAAILRAQEQQAAQQQLGGLLGGMRQQDFMGQQMAQQQEQDYLRGLLSAESAQQQGGLAAQSINAGVAQQNAQMLAQARQQKAQSDAAMIGGLFSGAGAALGAA